MMTRYRGFAATAAVCLTALASHAPAARADRDFGDRHYQGHHWHGEIRRFGDHDFEHWRGGHWYRGPHLGRLGWWWIVGGVWYFYPEPVYPYPDPYVPPVVVAPEAVVPPTPAPPPVPSNWYWCDSPKGYYPYVPQCPGGWRSVPAQP
jgi:hypothetical protein